MLPPLVLPLLHFLAGLAPATGEAPLEGIREDAPSIGALRALEEEAMAAAAKALPAMVFIDGGSGVLVDPDGSIITNNHVIAEAVQAQVKAGRKASEIRIPVYLLGGRRVEADLVGRDPGGDIALLRMRNLGPYPHLELGDSDAVRPGHRVLAMGNPFLIGEGPFSFFAGPSDVSPSISLGVVSALHRSSSLYPDAIQVDVAVNPGNSGGPLIAMDGKVVGITGKIQTRFLIEVNSGVGYAVPSNQIRRFLEPLARAAGGIVQRGTIVGLHVEERGDAERGLKINWVVAGTPGARAGFRPGDRILAIEGQPIWSKRRFDGLLATYPAGSKVKVRFDRDGTAREVESILDPEAAAWLGVFGEDAGGAGGGARVRRIEKRSPAEKAGLRAGDVILRVEEVKIETLVDLKGAIESRRAGQTVEMVILRDGAEEKITVRLEARPDG